MLKTIQEVLKEMDVERLASTFAFRRPLGPIDVMMLGLENSTFREVEKMEKERIRKAVSEMLSLNAEKNESPLVLYAQYGVEGGENRLDLHEKTTFSFCSPTEIKEDLEEAPDYDVSMTRWETSVGYLVSDSPLTQENLYEAISEYMREALLFGDSPESQKSGAENLMRKLKEAEKDMENGRFYSFDEMREELFGAEDVERRQALYDPEREEDEASLCSAAFAFFKKYRAKERMRILESV